MRRQDNHMPPKLATPTKPIKGALRRRRKSKTIQKNYLKDNRGDRKTEQYGIWQIQRYN